MSAAKRFAQLSKALYESYGDLAQDVTSHNERLLKREISN